MQRRSVGVGQEVGGDVPVVPDGHGLEIPTRTLPLRGKRFPSVAASATPPRTPSGPPGCDLERQGVGARPVPWRLATACFLLATDKRNSLATVDLLM